MVPHPTPSYFVVLHLFIMMYQVELCSEAQKVSRLFVSEVFQLPNARMEVTAPFLDNHKERKKGDTYPLYYYV